MEHGAREFAGEGVLLARMIRAEQEPTRQPTGDAMPELRSRRGNGDPFELADLQILIKGDFPQRNDDQLVRQQRHFLRSEEHTSELQSRQYLVCRLLLEKKKRRSPLMHSLAARPPPLQSRTTRLSTN